MNTGVPTTAVRMPGGDFNRRERTCDRVDREHERRADQRGNGREARELGTDDKPRHVRHDEAHPADDARHGDARGRRQCRGGDHDRAQAPRVHAERTCLVLGQREQVDAPCKREQHRERERHGGQKARELLSRCRREAAHQPERDRWKLVVGIGEILEQRNRGAEQARDDDAGEDQRHERIVRGQSRRDQHDDADRREAAGERRDLDRDEARAEKDSEDCAERRARRYAERVRRDQRVAKQMLVRGSRRRERGAHEHRDTYAWHSNLPDDGIAHADGGIAGHAPPDSVRDIGDRQRVAPRAERDEN